MICPTCNTYPMVHPKKGGLSMTCTGCKKAPEQCACDHTISMEAHIKELLK